jgi:hypothetical protein
MVKLSGANPPTFRSQPLQPRFQDPATITQNCTSLYVMLQQSSLRADIGPAPESARLLDSRVCLKKQSYSECWSEKRLHEDVLTRCDMCSRASHILRQLGLY